MASDAKHNKGHETLSEPVQWAKDNGIPTEWVKDYKSFDALAMMYDETAEGKAQFIKDFNVSKEQKPLCGDLFVYLRNYRRQSVQTVSLSRSNTRSSNTRSSNTRRMNLSNETSLIVYEKSGSDKSHSMAIPEVEDEKSHSIGESDSSRTKTADRQTRVDLDAATHETELSRAEIEKKEKIAEIDDQLKLIKYYLCALAGWLIAVLVALQNDGVNNGYCIFSAAGFVVLLLFWIVTGLPLLFSPLLPSPPCSKNECGRCLAKLNDNKKFETAAKRMKIGIGVLLDFGAFLVKYAGITVGNTAAAVLWAISGLILLLLVWWNLVIQKKLKAVKQQKEGKDARVQKVISLAVGVTRHPPASPHSRHGGIVVENELAANMGGGGHVLGSVNTIEEGIETDAGS